MQLSQEYLQTLKNLSGEEKLRSAFQLYWSSRKLKASFLRRKHPEWTEEMVQDEVKRIFANATA